MELPLSLRFTVSRVGEGNEVARAYKLVVLIYNSFQNEEKYLNFMNIMRRFPISLLSLLSYWLRNGNRVAH